MVENLVQFGCKIDFIAYELARDNGIAKPDKKDIYNYSKTLTRKLNREFGMNFVQYRDFFKDKLKSTAWKVYLDESINKRNPRLIKDLMDRLDGKPQDSLKLSGDPSSPITTDSNITIEFVDKKIE